jgi:hypothetical protein
LIGSCLHWISLSGGRPIHLLRSQHMITWVTASYGKASRAVAIRESRL